LHGVSVLVIGNRLGFESDENGLNVGRKGQ